MKQHRRLGQQLYHLPTWAALFAFIAGVLLFCAPSNQREIAIRTFLLGLSASSLAFPLAALAAWTIRESAVVGRWLFRACICLAVIPVYLNVGFQDAAIGKLGWLTSNGDQVLTPLISGWSAAAWAHATSLLPQFVLLILFCLGTKRAFEEQGLIEASAWQVFFHITLPRLLPLGLLSALWGIVVCSREIAVTDLYQIGTMAEQLYLGYALNQPGGTAGNWTADQLAQAGNVGLPISLSIFFALSSVATLAVIMFNRQIQENQDLTNSLMPKRPFDKDDSNLATVIGVVIMLLLIAVPFFNVVYRVGLAVETNTEGPELIWRTSNVISAISRTSADHHDAFYWSAIIALISSTVVLLTAFAGCWMARGRKIFAAALMLIWVVLCGCSGPAIGISITKCFANSSLSPVIWLYDQTIFPAVLANSIFVWPIAVIGTWAVVSRVPQNQLDHAATENMGAFRRAFEFGVRQNSRTFLGLWILLGAICFGELSATQMVTPPGIETVPQVTLGKLHAGVDEATAALTILTTGLIVAIAWLGGIIAGITSSRRQTVQAPNAPNR
jgi:iron(III) transport system permease protein